jgi:hypothetical protein
MVFKFLITAGSSWSNKYNSKESPVLWVFEKKIVSRNHQLWYMKKIFRIEELPVLGISKISKNCQVS